MATNVICLVIDRLHIGYLGAYGNTWINTPNFDQLAAESVLFDRMLIDTPRIDLLYRSLWTGMHAVCSAQRAAARQPLPAIFSKAGWQTTLLTDDREIAGHPLADGFQQRVVTSVASKSGSGNQNTAASLEDTDAALFFAAANQCIEAAQSPFLLWLHTHTLGRIWDAPLEFRQHYIDEDDPPAGDCVEVPNRMLPEQFDLDERVAIAHAYAGQVSAVDQLLGTLLESIDARGKSEATLVTLLSPRGFPLGEHHRVGSCDDALYAELTHVPWLLRLPNGEAAGERHQLLVQPAELPASILDLIGLDPWTTDHSQIGVGQSVAPLIRGMNESGFDRACTIGPGNRRRITTAAWTLRVSQPAARPTAPLGSVAMSKEADVQDQQSELFAKPDDWYEISEVGNRCPEIVNQLHAALNAFQESCELGRPPVLAELPEELVTRVDSRKNAKAKRNLPVYPSCPAAPDR